MYSTVTMKYIYRSIIEVSNYTAVCNNPMSVAQSNSIIIITIVTA